MFLGYLRGLTHRCPREYFHILCLIERFRYQPGLEGEAQIGGSHFSILPSCLNLIANPILSIGWVEIQVIQSRGRSIQTGIKNQKLTHIVK